MDVKTFREKTRIVVTDELIKSVLDGFIASELLFYNPKNSLMACLENDKENAGLINSTDNNNFLVTLMLDGLFEKFGGKDKYLELSDEYKVKFSKDEREKIDKVLNTKSKIIYSSKGIVLNDDTGLLEHEFIIKVRPEDFISVLDAIYSEIKKKRLDSLRIVTPATRFIEVGYSSPIRLRCSSIDLQNTLNLLDSLNEKIKRKARPVLPIYSVSSLWYGYQQCNFLDKDAPVLLCSAIYEAILEAVDNYVEENDLYINDSLTMKDYLQNSKNKYVAVRDIIRKSLEYNQDLITSIIEMAKSKFIDFNINVVDCLKIDSIERRLDSIYGSLPVPEKQSIQEEQKELTLRVSSNVNNAKEEPQEAETPAMAGIEEIIAEAEKELAKEVVELTSEEIPEVPEEPTNDVGEVVDEINAEEQQEAVDLADEETAEETPSTEDVVEETVMSPEEPIQEVIEANNEEISTQDVPQEETQEEIPQEIEEAAPALGGIEEIIAEAEKELAEQVVELTSEEIPEEEAIDVISESQESIPVEVEEETLAAETAAEEITQVLEEQPQEEVEEEQEAAEEEIPVTEDVIEETTEILEEPETPEKVIEETPSIEDVAEETTLEPVEEEQPQEEANLTAEESVEVDRDKENILDEPSEEEVVVPINTPQEEAKEEIQVTEEVLEETNEPQEETQEETQQEIAEAAPALGGIEEIIAEAEKDLTKEVVELTDEEIPGVPEEPTNNVREVVDEINVEEQEEVTEPTNEETVEEEQVAQEIESILENSSEEIPEEETIDVINESQENIPVEVEEETLATETAVEETVVSPEEPIQEIIETNNEEISTQDVPQEETQEEIPQEIAEAAPALGGIEEIIAAAEKELAEEEAIDVLSESQESIPAEVEEETLAAETDVEETVETQEESAQEVDEPTNEESVEEEQVGQDVENTLEETLEEESIDTISESEEDVKEEEPVVDDTSVTENDIKETEEIKEDTPEEEPVAQNIDDVSENTLEETPEEETIDTINEPQEEISAQEETVEEIPVIEDVVEEAFEPQEEQLQEAVESNDEEKIEEAPVASEIIEETPEVQEEQIPAPVSEIEKINDEFNLEDKIISETQRMLDNLDRETETASVARDTDENGLDANSLLETIPSSEDIERLLNEESEEEEQVSQDIEDISENSFESTLEEDVVAPTNETEEIKEDTSEEVQEETPTIEEVVEDNPEIQEVVDSNEEVKELEEEVNQTLDSISEDTLDEAHEEEVVVPTNTPQEETVEEIPVTEDALEETVEPQEEVIEDQAPVSVSELEAIDGEINLEDKIISETQRVLDNEDKEIVNTSDAIVALENEKDSVEALETIPLFTNIEWLTAEETVEVNPDLVNILENSLEPTLDEEIMTALQESKEENNDEPQEEVIEETAIEEVAEVVPEIQEEATNDIEEANEEQTETVVDDSVQEEQSIEPESELVETLEVQEDIQENQNVASESESEEVNDEAEENTSDAEVKNDEETDFKELLKQVALSEYLTTSENVQLEDGDETLAKLEESIKTAIEKIKVLEDKKENDIDYKILKGSENPEFINKENVLIPDLSNTSYDGDDLVTALSVGGYYTDNEYINSLARHFKLDESLDPEERNSIILDNLRHSYKFDKDGKQLPEIKILPKSKADELYAQDVEKSIEDVIIPDLSDAIYQGNDLKETLRRSGYYTDDEYIKKVAQKLGMIDFKGTTEEKEILLTKLRHLDKALDGKEKYLDFVSDITLLDRKVKGQDYTIYEYFEKYNLLDHVKPRSIVIMHDQGLEVSGRTFVNQYLIFYLLNMGAEDLDKVINYYAERIKKPKALKRV